MSGGGVRFSHLCQFWRVAIIGRRFAFAFIIMDKVLFQVCNKSTSFTLRGMGGAGR
jgi:hypothetical protein